METKLQDTIRDLNVTKLRQDVNDLLTRKGSGVSQGAERVDLSADLEILRKQDVEELRRDVSDLERNLVEKIGAIDVRIATSENKLCELEESSGSRRPS